MSSDIPNPSEESAEILATEILATEILAPDPPALPIPRDDNSHELVSVGPDLTFGTVGMFRQEITDLIARGSVRLVVDLRASEQIDAVGLGALVAARRRLHASHGCLHLVAGAHVLQRLGSSGLQRFFDLAPDPATAGAHGGPGLPEPELPDPELPEQRSSAV